jgi:thiol-disulfide isomerase/thioredoxin
MPIINPLPWESWPVLLFFIPVEMGLGIWLLSGLFKKAGWLLAVILYVVFMFATLYRAIKGMDSCGCFGPFDVNPWITFFAIDITVLAGLLIFRPRGEKLLPPPWPGAIHFFSVAIPTFILLPSMFVFMLLNKPPDIKEPVGRKKGYKVVKTDEWKIKNLDENQKKKLVQAEQGRSNPSQTTEVNQPALKAIDTAEPNQPSEQTTAGSPKLQNTEKWPMLDYIDIADSIKEGVFVVVFWRHDCPDCHEAIPEYDKFSKETEVVRFVFIEVPPFGSEEQNFIPKDTICLTGKLDENMEWLNITTPFVVAIMDGCVLKYWEAQAPKTDEIIKAVFSEN